MLSPIRMFFLSLCAYLAVAAYASRPLCVMPEGRCVKIRVAQTGIHELDYDVLRNLGFTSPEKVAVFGYGGVLPDEDNINEVIKRGLPRQTSVHHDGKLIFFGQSGLKVNVLSMNPDEAPEVTANPYSLYGYYFLAESESFHDSGFEAFMDPVGVCHDGHLHLEVIDRDLVSYLGMGTGWFDLPLGQSGTSVYEFTPVGAPVDAVVHIRWLTDIAGSLKLGLEGGTVGVTEGLTVEQVKVPSIRRSAAGCSLFGGEAPRLSVGFDESVTGGGFTAIDHLALAYMLPSRLDGEAQRLMYIGPIADGDFVDCQDAVEIWDVTSAADVSRHAVVDGKMTPRPCESVRRLVAFNPDSTLLAPEIVGEADLGPIHDGLDEVDMIVVAHPNLEDAANELAVMHGQYQGLNVKVVTDSQIYDAMSSGAPSASAIRAYVGRAYRQSGSRLKYLLLYGDGSYDNRGVAVTGDYLPTYQCPLERYMFDPERSYCSDAYFGMVDSVLNPERMFYGAVNLGVGRLPVRSPDEAHAVNEKIRRHLAFRPQSLCAYEGVFLCDAGDRNLHLKHAEALAGEFSVNRGAVVHKVYSDMSRWVDGKAPIAREELARCLRYGCGYVHYVGHGTEYNIGGQDLWSNSAVAGTEYDIKPIVFHSSCLNGRFDGDRRSLAEEMLSSRCGGAVACIMAARSTDASYNQQLHLEFMRQVGGAGPGATLGDVWMKAQNKCVDAARSFNNASYAINVRHFNLLGDPALPLPYADCAVVASEIDGKEVLPGVGPVVTGCGVSVAGHVVDADGAVMPDFDGDVYVRAYLADVVRCSLGQDGSGTTQDVSCGDVLVAEGSGLVEGGMFEVAINLPVSTVGHSYRLVYSALSDDKCALGELDGLIVGDSSGGEPDVTAPVITGLGLSGAILSGMAVSPDAIIAEIADEGSGLCLSGYVLGDGCVLSVDGVAVRGTSSYIRHRGDGLWHLEYPLSGLCDGRHELTLSVSDNAGNRSEMSQTVTVINRDATIELAVESRSVRDKALLAWTHDFDSDDVQTALIVRDLNGTTVCRELFDGSACRYEWNLNGLDGYPVGNGPYDCMVLATDGRRYTSSALLRIIVIH